jgi:hypothetical protein
MYRKYSALFGVAVLTLIFISTSGQAQNRPIQLSLFTPIQIFPEDNAIKGFRLNLIYGRNVSITGLDLGLINHTTTGKSSGWQNGLVGLSDSDFRGWQNNLVNVTKGKFNGFQWGIVNYAKDMSGVQFDVVALNVTKGKFKGLQFGAINYAQDMSGVQINEWVNATKGKFKGFQMGTINYAKNMSGFQLGTVNYAETVTSGFQLSVVNYANIMNGLQIGLVNIIRQGGVFPVLPLVNWSF